MIENVELKMVCIDQRMVGKRPDYFELVGGVVWGRDYKCPISHCMY